MRCFKLVSAILLAVNTLLVNGEVTFKVIAISGTPSVVVNKKKYSMEVEEYPVYSVTVADVNPPVQYHYVLGSEEEEFTRTADSETTLNDFFNRSITVKKHPLLPMAYDILPTLKKSKLYDDTFVSTILIEANKSDINALHANPNEDTKYKCTVTYVSPYTIKTYKNAGIKISGQSTKYNMKLSYKLSGLKTEDDKELFNRTGIKLRSEYGDPSFLREKTFFDMLNTLGVPTSNGKFARVYINKDPIGLFLITDDFSNKHFLRSAFNSGKKFELENAIFKVNENGDLKYKGDSEELLEPYSYKGDNEVAKESYSGSLRKVRELLVPFMKDVNNYPKTKKLNFDIESFLRAMALEYLAYGPDNYWMSQSNYFFFRNNATEQWHFIDSDFDMSFGHGSPDKCLKTTLDNYTSIKNEDNSRPFIDNLRTVKENNDYLKSAVKRLLKTSFNINAAGPRIDSLAKLIKEDALWDFDLPRVNSYEGDHVVKEKQYTETDFNRETGKTSKSYPWAIQKWILERSNAVGSIYDFDVPSKPSEDLGYYEPEYEKKKDKSNKVTTTTTTTTTKASTTTTTTKASTTTTTTKAKTTTTTTTTKSSLPTAGSDGKCGPNKAVCKKGQCCSSKGYCGTSSAYCGTGCQSEFGECSTKNLPKVGENKKCGVGIATCEEGLCCSYKGYCGKTNAHCGTGCKTEFGRCGIPKENLPKVGNNEKCGKNVATCEEGLCCSSKGYCGKTNAHCGTGCQSEFGKCGITTTTTTTTTKASTTTKTTTTKASTTTTTKTTTTVTSTKPLSTSTNGKCGPDYGVCPNNNCCSKYGYCGTSTAYCGTGCQSEFGKCSTEDLPKVGENKKCGAGIATCEEGLCCSSKGYCGKTNAHCGTGCQNEFGKCGVTTTTTKASTTTTTTKASTTTTTTKAKTTTTTTTTKSSLPTAGSDGKCGPNKAVCKKGQCCSSKGYCGTSSAYCGTGCQSEFGECSTKNLPKVGENKKCGVGIATCEEGLCCSYKGYCGKTNAHCGTGCKTEFGRCGIPKENLPKVGNNEKCGKNVATCEEGLCCSSKGYCGKTNAHCGTGCQSEFGKCGINTTTTTKASTTTKKTTTTKASTTTTTKTTTTRTTTKTTTTNTPTPTTTKTTTTMTSTKPLSTSTNGKCGPGYGVCPNNYCCSQYGYCGTSDMYCGYGCDKEYGVCW